MGLKENQTYGTQNRMIPTVKASYDLSRSLPQKQQKSINVKSQYPNISNNIGLSGLGTITTPYGGSTKFEKYHPGVDIANKIGTPIPFTTAGTVSEVVSGKKQGDPGYGNYVIVTDQQGNKHRYSHLDRAFVSVGQQVRPGQTGITMGNTGKTYSLHGGTGSHLDYRIRDLYGKYINPFSYLKQ